MHLNIQVLLGISLSTLALTSWVPTSPKTHHSIRPTIDDGDFDDSTPFNVTVNGRAVGYGTEEIYNGGFKALVLQPDGVPGSTFTLQQGLLTTIDNRIVCRFAIEDRSLLPKRMFTAPLGASLQFPTRWAIISSGGVQRLTLLQSGSQTPIIREKSSPEGLDWFYMPLLDERGPDWTLSNADASSSSFLIHQENRGRECL